MKFYEVLETIVANADAHLEGKRFEIETFQVLERVGAHLRAEAQIKIPEGLLDVGKIFESGMIESEGAGQVEPLNVKRSELFDSAGCDLTAVR